MALTKEGFRQNFAEDLDDEEAGAFDKAEGSEDKEIEGAEGGGKAAKQDNNGRDERTEAKKAREKVENGVEEGTILSPLHLQLKGLSDLAWAGAIQRQNLSALMYFNLYYRYTFAFNCTASR
ncbi:hypothetical protein L7F22_060800 [Adiantum nelumboides]|nr:hypothetical protein [Adiantum nelumboides]